MESQEGMITTMNTMKWICYGVGYVFIASGILKLLDSNFIGVFMGLGLPFPEFTLYLVAITEVACGMLILGRMYLNIAVPPLLLIMLGAIFLTKLPVIWSESIFSFAFEARLDIILIILLLLIRQHMGMKKTSY